MRIAVLAGNGQSTNILLNWLCDSGYNDVRVIVEDKPSRLSLFRARRRRLGSVRAIGQVLFVLCVVPVLRRSSRARREEILSSHRLRDGTPSMNSITRVSSINDSAVITELVEYAPHVILVNGTRIIRRDIIDAVAVNILNTHVGITPAYRGVHGGYWALWSRDPENFGVTLHLVDSGVDTGRIVSQRFGKPDGADNFVSYPVLQQAIILPALYEVLKIIEGAGELPIAESSQMLSRQWYHPTLWGYLAGRMRGIK